nr:hypothetical protein [Tanacetum cinerariifolium]
MGFNDISDAVLAHLKGLNRLKCLELSDTEDGNNGLHHLPDLVNLESLNLSFTVITDGGLRSLAKLSSLKSLNLDVHQITDAGLAALTNKQEKDKIETKPDENGKRGRARQCKSPVTVKKAEK